ncbi:ATP-binding protein [Candidatus Magnetomorum sp. HK-1]|nr:ATP-binding protein [Candidatus Magnetomorum sp. HK-1]
MLKTDYSIKSSFINRQKELSFIYDWFHREPNNILFLYGPKSSGKTTLLMKFIEIHLNQKIYDIKHFNLREILLTSYSDFIQAFFEIDYSKQDTKVKREYNLKVFKLSKEIIKSMENKTLDPFVVMKNEFIKIARKGKRPILIIDELQALDNIYMSDQRELLKELFNFFVAMTKESHLCHIIIASSDGYFLNRIYDDSKLSKTSRFFEISYLNEKDTKYWLSNLEKESAIRSYKLSDDQINTIWKYIGGSVWEITSVLGELISNAKNDKISNDDLMNVIHEMIKINKGKFNHYAKINKSKRALFKQILFIQNQKDEFSETDLELLVNKGFYEESSLTEELSHLVRLNFLTFDPTTSFYSLQGKSMFYGLKEFIQN